MNIKKYIFLLLLVAISKSLYSQQNEILLKGIVVDEGVPVSGVMILEEGTTNGTITNFDGYFELKIKKGANLTVSFTGFSPIEIEDVKYSNLKIVLSDRSVIYCCENHDPSHCAENFEEMQELTEKHECSF